MFGLFKKKTKICSLYSVCDGHFKNLSDVNDAVFAEKIMGDGYAITPNSGTVAVYSPLKGKVLSVFPTKHAITFQTSEGVEALIHMGLETVTLKGEGFEVHVKEGDSIDETTLIACMDVDFLVQKNCETDIIIVITNLEKNKTIELNPHQDVSSMQMVGRVIVD